MIIVLTALHYGALDYLGFLCFKHNLDTAQFHFDELLRIKRGPCRYEPWSIRALVDVHRITDRGNENASPLTAKTIIRSIFSFSRWETILPSSYRKLEGVTD